MKQPSLFDTEHGELEVKPARAMVSFLSGVATASAYGETPTAEQKRAGARVGEECATLIAQLKADFIRQGG